MNHHFLVGFVMKEISPSATFVKRAAILVGSVMERVIVKNVRVRANRLVKNVGRMLQKGE